MKKSNRQTRMLLALVFGVVLSLSAAPVLHASEALVAQSNKAYNEGLYAEAAKLYEQVAATGYESPELYYNTGNARFKLNDFPGAILWYERARRLDPGNEDILFNLNVANSKIADKIEPVPEMFYRRWYFTLVDRLSADGWAWASVSCFLAAFAMAVLYLLASRMFLRKAGFWSAGVFLVLFLFGLVFSFSANEKAYNTEEAIIFTPTVTVKSSPDEKSIDLFVLHEGTKVRIMDRIGEWYEVRIANGSVGWLLSSTMERI